MGVIRKLDPFRHFVGPAALAIVIAAVSLSGSAYARSLDVIPGAILCVLGTRVAYGHQVERLVGTTRNAFPSGMGMPPGLQRQIGGATIATAGIFFLAIAATGIADLVS